MTVTEKGLLHTNPDSSSGIVLVQSSTDQNILVFVGWTNSTNNLNLSGAVSGAVSGFNTGAGGTGLSTGPLSYATTKAGYTVYYETFSDTVQGAHLNGVWSVWYSTHGQRLYQLGFVTDGSNAQSTFNTSLSSFTEA